MIATGDEQPAEKKPAESRWMPEVCLDCSQGWRMWLRDRDLSLNHQPDRHGKRLFCTVSISRATVASVSTAQDLGLIYRVMGRRGLESIENVGPKMAEVVEGLINGLARVS